MEAEEDAKVFMAKWDKGRFQVHGLQGGQRVVFCLCTPTTGGQPVHLVVPTSLQMGWVESPPYFCATTETAQDIATDYLETGIGTQPQHKFEQYATGSTDYTKLPVISEGNSNLRYMLEVYVDDFFSLVIPTSQAQLRHIANAIIKGIHDVFPPDDDNGNDLISKKKLLKDEGR